MIILACLLSLTGCRATVSSIQEKQNSLLTHTTTVEGTELKLHADLLRRAGKDNTIDLQGTLTVTAVNGQLPEALDLYHLALRPAKSGYYIQNFKRNQENAWHYPATRRSSRSFHAQARRTDDSLVLTFNLLDTASLFTKASDYDVMDVTVSIMDSAGQRHALALPGQAARLEQSSD